MLNAKAILTMHDAFNQAAHQQQALPQALSALEQLTLQQHRANFDLWHEEDKARTPHPVPALIVTVKQNIDRLNQQRNDLVEQIDLALLAAATQNDAAPLHSETPGLIVDRLSILSLKIFHTAEEVARADASDTHHARNLERLAILTSQREDLAQCLTDLWQQVMAGSRRFKLYRQMKMYNDSSLNPVLYRARNSPAD